jgi:hypothetical protein
MKYLARLSSLVAAAVCLAVPSTGFSHDHDHGHGSWHGGSWHGRGYCGPHVNFYGGFFPFAAAALAYPLYSSLAYDTPSYESYYGDSGPVYRGAPVAVHGDDLAVDVQRALRRDGYYHGGIDGDIGSGTRGAIREYQYDHHLEVTGRIDRALLRSLGIE